MNTTRKTKMTLKRTPAKHPKAPQPKAKVKATAAKPQQFKTEAEEADWLASPAGRKYTHQLFEDAAKNGTLRHGTPPNALKALAAAGRTVSINIRVAAADVQKARELADEKGVGYQTIIKMLLHEALKK